MELKDFVQSRAVLDDIDVEVVAKIRPLPADIVPSKRFQEQTRLRLLQLNAPDRATRQAA